MQYCDIYSALCAVAQIEELHETQADMRRVGLKDLHSQTFYRSANTLIVRAHFIHTEL